MALLEAHRILKPGGLLFAAGINRLGIVRELFNSQRYFKEQKISIVDIKSRVETCLKTGCSNADIFPPLGDAYLATAKGFCEEMEDHFTKIEFLGIESFAAYNQKLFLEKDNLEVEAWLDLLEITASMDEGIASAEHFLFIGKKK